MVSISTITSLGNVLRERNRITNRVISWTIPTTDTSKTRNINLLGKKRIITLLGQFSGSTAEMSAFIDEVEAWINEAGVLKTQSTRSYINSFSKTYNVICLDFYWEYTSQFKRKIDYIFELVQGGTIS